MNEHLGVHSQVASTVSRRSRQPEPPVIDGLERPLVWSPRTLTRS